jgi:hypothetical protein
VRENGLRPILSGRRATRVSFGDAIGLAGHRSTKFLSTVELSRCLCINATYRLNLPPRAGTSQAPPTPGAFFSPVVTSGASGTGDRRRAEPPFQEDPTGRDCAVAGSRSRAQAATGRKNPGCGSTRGSPSGRPT